MSLYIVDIHGELEGDYEIIKKYEEPTKNNLGVEYISRSALMAVLSDYHDTTIEFRSMLKEIASLPVVTPQEPTDKNFTKADIDAIVKAINAHWELIIDEIRAEIAEIHLIGYATVDGKREIASRAVMQILDKYKAEAEGT